MSFDTMLIKFTNRTAAFWLKTAQRLKEAKDAGSAYTADQFAAAAAGTLLDSIDVWSSVVVDVPTPLVPTMFIKDTAANFLLGVKAVGSVTYSVPSAITVTNLGSLGGGAPIPSSAVTVTVTGVELGVTVKTGAAPAVGTYLGVAFAGTPAQPIAQIVAVVS